MSELAVENSDDEYQDDFVVIVSSKIPSRPGTFIIEHSVYGPYRGLDLGQSMVVAARRKLPECEVQLKCLISGRDFS